MDTLKINTGEKRLAVSVDGVNGREIVFNPNDVLFIEKLHRLYRVAMEQAREWDRREPEISAAIQAIPVDENGVPETVDPAVDPLVEINRFMRKQIDDLFGAGTSEAIFGAAVYRNPSIYLQLVEGVKPYIEQVREQRVQQYIAPIPKAKRKPRKRTK